MRIYEYLKEKTVKFTDYVAGLSKGPAVAGLGAGAGSGFYIGGIFYPLIKWGAFFVGTGSGTLIGIATVYGVEKENLELIEEKKTAISQLKATRHKFLVTYFTLKGQHNAQENLQITSRASTRKSSISLSNTAYSRIRGTTELQAPKDPVEALPCEYQEEKSAQNQGESISLTKKILIFTKNSNWYQRGTMISYFAMTCYYLQLSMDQYLGMEKWLAWVLGIIISTPTSPALAYATASSSQGILSSLKKEEKFWINQNNFLESKVRELKNDFTEDNVEASNVEPEYTEINLNFTPISASTHLLINQKNNSVQLSDLATNDSSTDSDNSSQSRCYIL
ncbi:MAG: hypothetical protein JSR33_03680 [Proteobacteria bacterium]|nr:hypothetical protein [Pseudomonadota bacterium]